MWLAGCPYKPPSFFIPSTPSRCSSLSPFILLSSPQHHLLALSVEIIEDLCDTATQYSVAFLHSWVMTQQWVIWASEKRVPNCFLRHVLSKDIGFVKSPGYSQAATL